MSGPKTGYIRYTLKHGNFFVGIASAAIAMMALALTVDAGIVDRHYREISIRPFLNFTSRSGDFSYEIKNSGLGPAVINALTFTSNGACKTYDENNSADWEK